MTTAGSVRIEIIVEDAEGRREKETELYFVQGGGEKRNSDILYSGRK